MPANSLRRFLALSATLLILLTACGGETGDEDIADESETTEETTTADDDAEATADDEAAAAGDGEGITFGMILVGPRDDRGWSQAHFEGGEYIEENLPGSEMIAIDSVNPADNPELSVESVATDMIDQGAQLIFATSDDMRDGILAAAAEHPDVPMIWSSGDSAWEEGRAYMPELENLGNIMGRMEVGKAIAGCAAAMHSDAGHIAYLGPLVNAETIRLVNSAYLGAQHCWTENRGEDPADLTFEVTYIGFWFNIPGVTLDPTQVVNDFYAGGADVVVSGIDTTEAIVRTGQLAESGEAVTAVPYDFIGACDEAPAVCLGVPYFNWGPSYLETAQAVVDDSFDAEWRWLGPDEDDINDLDSSIIGFIKGDGLGEDAEAAVDALTAGLLDGSIELFEGPLVLADGTTYIAEGEVATDEQVWYFPDLLEGIDGVAETQE
ncbi:BMP family lipoprotein [Euzebya tangerina]|uniref:BMP family lipoprotein n=1 Tax=Euzebya tangerina TaxID=591198 RepID=UPI000E30F4B9|nr:BMP family ABC transporter substrate-binding protein [Euzebya tangerina]